MSHLRLPDRETYTAAEVDAMIAFFGRRVGLLEAALKETDGLAPAGEQVGYESAYRILRRAVAEFVGPATSQEEVRAKT